jgi:hypothetical protein
MLQKAILKFNYMNDFDKIINEWNFKHKNKKPLKTSIVENKIFNY